MVDFLAMGPLITQLCSIIDLLKDLAKLIAIFCRIQDTRDCRDNLQMPLIITVVSWASGQDQKWTTGANAVGNRERSLKITIFFCFNVFYLYLPSLFEIIQCSKNIFLEYLYTMLVTCSNV